MNLFVTVDKNWNLAEDEILNLLSQNKNLLRDLTKNKIVVSSSKLFENLEEETKRNRIFVCLSKQQKQDENSVFYAKNLKELFEKLSFYKDENIFVVGGKSILSQLLPHSKKIFVTKIFDETNTNEKFENLDENKNFNLVKQSDPVFENDVVYYFCEYDVLKPKKFNYGYENDFIF